MSKKSIQLNCEYEENKWYLDSYWGEIFKVDKLYNSDQAVKVTGQDGIERIHCTERKSHDLEVNKSCMQCNKKKNYYVCKQCNNRIITS